MEGVHPPLTFWVLWPLISYLSCFVLCSQLCLTLCDSMDCNPPGSSVHGIFQAKILERVAISSPRRSSPPRDWTHVSYVSCITGSFLICWATGETLPPAYTSAIILLCISSLFSWTYSQSRVSDSHLQRKMETRSCSPLQLPLARNSPLLVWVDPPNRAGVLIFLHLHIGE